MSEIKTPEFASYKEEAEFWDNFDTSNHMPEDGWEEIAMDTKRPIRIAIVPDIAEELSRRAHRQGVSTETLVNLLLADLIREPVPST